MPARKLWSLLFQVGGASASPSPICSTRTSPSAGDIFRRDYQLVQTRRRPTIRKQTTYNQVSTTASRPASAIQLTEYWSLADALRPQSYDNVDARQSTYYSTRTPTAISSAIRSSPGRLSLRRGGQADRRRRSATRIVVRQSEQPDLRPSKGNAFRRSARISAGPRRRASNMSGTRCPKATNIGHDLGNRGFVLNLAVPEAGYILPYGCAALRRGRSTRSIGVRLTDRFYLGEPQLRGLRHPRHRPARRRAIR